VGVPEIWTRPELADTIGTLNPGALLQGFVPAVAVTVWTELRVTIPEERDVAEESVTVPDVTVVGPVEVTVPETVTEPDTGTVCVMATLNPPVEETGAIAPWALDPEMSIASL